MKDIKRDWQKYLMLSIPVALVLLFSYFPMYGVLLAFKKYNTFLGFWESPWVGMENFIRIFNLPRFARVVTNTLRLNLLQLLLGFPAPILFALLLNEMRSVKMMRAVQTVSYLPHFLSTVIIYGIVFQLCAPTTGLLNQIAVAVSDALGRDSSVLAVYGLPFLTVPSWWMGTYIVSGIWSGIGWGSIIYIATITGINPELYEAAEVDGAGRLKKIRHITLPGLKPTIALLLILNIGGIASIGFEKPWLFVNPLVQDIGEVISVYIYNVGLGRGDFSAANVVGLTQSVVNVILVLTANSIAKMLGQDGLM